MIDSATRVWIPMRGSSGGGFGGFDLAVLMIFSNLFGNMFEDLQATQARRTGRRRCAFKQASELTKRLLYENIKLTNTFPPTLRRHRAEKGLAKPTFISVPRNTHFTNISFGLPINVQTRRCGGTVSGKPCKRMRRQGKRVRLSPLP